MQTPNLNNLTPRQQRWLALGLLLSLLLTAVILVILPWYFKLSEYNESIVKMEDRLRRYAEKTVDRQQASKETENIRARIQQLGVFNSESTEALALAKMQEKIKTAVAAAEGNLMSTQVMAEQKVEGLTKIVVKVRFAGRVETLRRVLHELETSKPYMLIENLQITSVRGAMNPATRKMEPVDKVNVAMDVSSFMQPRQE